MRILHTADLHLGVTLGGFSRLEDQKEALDQIIALCTAYHADAVVLAGDIFDRAVASAEAIALYDRFLTALRREAGAYVFVLAGNHDGAARLTQLSGLLAETGIYLAGTLSARPVPIDLPEAQIFLIPFFHIEQVRALYPEAEIRTVHEAMSCLMDTVRTVRDPNRPAIVAAHCFVTGASPAESDVGAQLGGAQQVGAEVFHDIAYTALGHLHRAQMPAPGVWYAGTPCPYAFSEGDCSINLYDTHSGTVERLPLVPRRALRLVRGTYEDVFHHAQHDPASEDYVKIEITDRPVGMETLDALRQCYPRLVTLLGRNPDGVNAASLSVEQVQSLSPEELLTQFCTDVGGFAPTGEQKQRFLKALAQIREGGEVQ